MNEPIVEISPPFWLVSSWLFIQTHDQFRKAAIKLKLREQTGFLIVNFLFTETKM
jgi:hypothetical protein